ncbi:hypothetical protein M2283_001206 [Streptomyces pseudovenezuelae]|uniref:Uncharacterized protein n=2 Tax=Streptomyces pseudovenezuelae TaxID=67350 RepID=A0ABT6LC90_9ACTN|nr:hypothetical protein [Streptomyces pseudovenezuelae]
MRQMDVISNTVRIAGLSPHYSQRLHPSGRMLHTMSTTVEPAADRSADEVNEEIRALWHRSGGTLSVEQREEYQRLVLEWAAAAPQPAHAA